MIKKIVGIVVLMLVATTVVSASTINVKETTKSTSSNVDVPIWEVGDSWTYNDHWAVLMYPRGVYSEAIFYWNSTITYTVTDDTGDNYTVMITSKNPEGWFSLSAPYYFKFTPFLKYSEEYTFRKTDLGRVCSKYQIKGLLFWYFRLNGLLSIPAQAHLLGEQTFTPPVVLLPSPFTAGITGTLPPISSMGWETFSLYWGLYSVYDSLSLCRYLWDSPGPSTYTCEMETITVPAGTYEAYKITATRDFGIDGHDIWQTYYVPEVGYHVKQYTNIDWNDGGAPYWIESLELISTTYTP